MDFPRVSGDTYYLWLASAYSPVVQFREHRVEGEGICFHLDGGKAQLHGFVTVDDLSSAAKRNPQLWTRAMAYQQAFSDGMRKGIADGLGPSALTADQKTRLLAELAPPPELKDYALQWRSGWDIGYGYGLYISRKGRAVP